MEVVEKNELGLWGARNEGKKKTELDGQRLEVSVPLDQDGKLHFHLHFGRRVLGNSAHHSQLTNVAERIGMNELEIEVAFASAGKKLFGNSQYSESGVESGIEGEVEASREGGGKQGLEIEGVEVAVAGLTKVNRIRPHEHGDLNCFSCPVGREQLIEVHVTSTLGKNRLIFQEGGGAELDQVRQTHIERGHTVADDEGDDSGENGRRKTGA
jgi:hypothetical protein